MSPLSPSWHPIRSRRAWIVSSTLLLTGLLRLSSAQPVRTTLTPDASLGTRVTSQGPVHTILGGRRPNHGPNLFHSFERFSVGTGDIADFRAPTGVANILSRVTGGQASEIDGTLRSTIDGATRSTANLYLLNPSGVVFGPTARLDVGGSFHVSTADYLRLADGSRFFARLSDTSTLSVAAPEAFGFLWDSPAGIALQGSTLQVPEGATLAIVGGTIQISGGRSAADPAAPPTLTAPQGRVTVVSVAAPGEVNPHGVGQDLQALPRLGAIQISDGALLDTSGEGGGTITIRGGSLLVDTATLASDTLGRSHGAPIGMDIQIAGEAIVRHAGNVEREMGGITTHAGPDLDRVSTGDAGALRLVADRVRIVSSFIGSQAWQEGKAGETVVQARDIVLSDGAQISGTTQGAGRGGTVTVMATETLSLQGTSPDGPSGIFARTGGRGAAGSVNVQARDIVLSEGALISGTTLGAGQAGTVAVMATETLTFRGRDAEGRGPGVFASAAGPENASGSAGTMVVRARHIDLSDGAQIGSGTFGAGQGGQMTVEATETLTLRGFPTGVFVSTQGAGAAGAVDIRARQIALSDGAQINSDTEGRGQGGSVTVTATDMLTLRGTSPDQMRTSGVFSNTLGAVEGAGAAGTVDVRARNVVLSEGARISSITIGSGPAGRVAITAMETLILQGTSPDLRGTRVNPDGLFHAGLFAQTRGTGAGGDIVVHAPTIRLTEGAAISAQSTGTGAAGTIQLTAVDALLLRGHSAITTNAQHASGGAIQIAARTLVRLHDSEITTSVLGGDSQAGNITIDPQAVVLQNGHIRANAVEGRGGNITIRAGVFLADPASAVTASSETNIAGTINIQDPVANLNGIVAPLPQTMVAAEGLLRNRCLARLREGTVSTLVVRGREGVPTTPDGVLPGQLPAPPAVAEATLSPPVLPQEPGTLPASRRPQGRPPAGGTLPPHVLVLGCGS